MNDILYQNNKKFVIDENRRYFYYGKKKDFVWHKKPIGEDYSSIDVINQNDISENLNFKKINISKTDRNCFEI